MAGGADFTVDLKAAAETLKCGQLKRPRISWARVVLTLGDQKSCETWHAPKDIELDVDCVLVSERRFTKKKQRTSFPQPLQKCTEPYLITYPSSAGVMAYAGSANVR